MEGPDHVPEADPKFSTRAEVWPLRKCHCVIPKFAFAQLRIYQYIRKYSQIKSAITENLEDIILLILPNVTSIYYQQATKNLAETVRSSSFCLHKLIHDKKTHPWDLPPVNYSSTSFQIYLAKLYPNHLTSGNGTVTRSVAADATKAIPGNLLEAVKRKDAKRTRGDTRCETTREFGDDFMLTFETYDIHWHPLTSHVAGDEPKKKATSYFGVFGVRFTPNYGRLNWENGDKPVEILLYVVVFPYAWGVHPDLTQCTHLRVQFQWLSGRVSFRGYVTTFGCYHHGYTVIPIWAVFKTPVGWWLVRGLCYNILGMIMIHEVDIQFWTP